MRRTAIAVCLLLLTSEAFAANELKVDRRVITPDEIVTATVTLEGEAAGRDSLALPVQNLEILGEPSVSSEFSWTNGETRRTKVFTFRARAIKAGAARVGPVVLGPGLTLAPVAIEVVADAASKSNDPAVVLRELTRSGRDPIFVIVTADRERLFVGEPVVATWWLYNAANVQQSRVLRVPPMRDFWAEELNARDVAPQTVQVGDAFLQKFPIRSVVLVPLRSGRLQLEGIAIEAAIMRRIPGSPLSVFEGTLEEVTRTSAGLTIDAVPLPAGQPVDAVGTLQLDCRAPAAESRGPVAVDVTLSGRANLRAATAPRFASSVGRVQVEERGVTVTTDPSFAMTRRWRYLVFPERGGELVLPPLTMTVFDPASASRKELRCGGGPVNVSLAPAIEARPGGSAASATPANWRRYVPHVLVTLVFLATIAFAGPRLARSVRRRGEVRRLLRGTPAEIRGSVDAHLGSAATALAHEKSERGEAYRALVSLLNAAERERGDDWRREAAKRVADLLALRG